MGKRASSFRLTPGASDSRPTATGYCAAHLPPGSQRDEIIDLVRTGAAIQAQWIGRRPGALSMCVRNIVRWDRDLDVTFDRLLSLLRIESMKREHEGEGASCIESVNRGSETVVYHDHRGRHHVGFSHLRNLLTDARKEIHAKAKTVKTTS